MKENIPCLLLKLEHLSEWSAVAAFGLIMTQNLKLLNLKFPEPVQDAQSAAASRTSRRSTERSGSTWTGFLPPLLMQRPRTGAARPKPTGNPNVGLSSRSYVLVAAFIH